MFQPFLFTKKCVYTYFNLLRNADTRFIVSMLGIVLHLLFFRAIINYGIIWDNNNIKNLGLK